MSEHLPFFESPPTPVLDNPPTPTGATPPRELVRRLQERTRAALYAADLADQVAQLDPGVSAHYVAALVRALAEQLERDAALALQVAERGAP